MIAENRCTTGKAANASNTPETTIPRMKLAALKFKSMKLISTPSKPGTLIPRVFLIQSPIATCNSPIGTLVNIFESQHANIANGTFTRNRIATTTEKSICKGKTRSMEKKQPIASPAATVSLHGIQRERSNKGLVIARHHGRSRSRLCFSMR